MEAIVHWLTPALIVALAAWLRSDLRDMRQEIRDLRRDFTILAERVASLAERVASLAERVAHLEGALLRPAAPVGDGD
jgi:chromosome segregation ATPase